MRMVTFVNFATIKIGNVLKI